MYIMIQKKNIEVDVYNEYIETDVAVDEYHDIDKETYIDVDVYGDIDKEKDIGYNDIDKETDVEVDVYNEYIETDVAVAVDVGICIYIQVHLHCFPTSASDTVFPFSRRCELSMTSMT